MAILHRAELRPTKIELLQTWLPTRAWCGSSATLERVASFRFDDPAGEVGIETLLVRAGEELLQVPLTYRGAPVADQDSHLVGTWSTPCWGGDGCTTPAHLADGAPGQAMQPGRHGESSQPTRFGRVMGGVTRRALSHVRLDGAPTPELRGKWPTTPAGYLFRLRRSSVAG